MKKDDRATVVIEDMGVNGEGIGKVDGYTLFIKDAVIGDTVEVKVMKAKKYFGYARLVHIVAPSKFRVEPKCPVARQCGGCQLQELAYEKQLEFKKAKVLENLKRIGGLKTLPDCRIRGMEDPFRYRNKAQFPFGTDKEGHIITGFYAGRTHQIIPNMDCVLGIPQNELVLRCVVDFMNEFKIPAYDEETGKGLVRHALVRYGFSTKELMVCLVINGESIPNERVLTKRLQEIPGMTSITLSVNKEKTNVIMGTDVKLLWGQPYITDSIGEVKYQISPLSFYQVNPVQTEVLYGKALEYAGLTGQETVWDLYCGIGTISLFLAQKAKKVYGVEIIPQAIADARRNAEINGMDNVEFYVGKAEEVLPQRQQEEHIYADVIVVDPPRKGCEESLLQTMAEMKPQRIVYVSCDSATLARDIKYLGERGYVVERMELVDMFPSSVHVECVCLMTKKDK